MSEIIRLGGSAAEKIDSSISAQLQRLKKMPLPIRILGSPTTTAVLGTALGMLTGGVIGLPTTLMGGAKLVGTTAVIKGVLTTSPKAEEILKKKLHPTKAGEYIGTQIESFGKETEGADKLTWKEKAKEGLKKAGLIGGGIALAGAGALGLSKAIPYVKTKLEERKAAKKVGITEKDIAIPSTQLKQPYLPAQYPVISPVEGAAGLKQVPPIQNIIQIQVQ